MSTKKAQLAANDNSFRINLLPFRDTKRYALLRQLEQKHQRMSALCSKMHTDMAWVNEALCNPQYTTEQLQDLISKIEGVHYYVDLEHGQG